MWTLRSKHVWRKPQGQRMRQRKTPPSKHCRRKSSKPRRHHHQPSLTWQPLSKHCRGKPSSPPQRHHRTSRTWQPPSRRWNRGLNKYRQAMHRTPTGSPFKLQRQHLNRRRNLRLRSPRGCPARKMPAEIQSCMTRSGEATATRCEPYSGQAQTRMHETRTATR